jgi:rhodanese-related sulfurtransferase
MSTQFSNISPQQLHEAKRRGRYAPVLDVRSAAEYRAGRTDFQNGDPAAQYDSLFAKLLTLPEETLVYPAHDYNGMTVSTIGEEKHHNPRLQVSDKQAYIELMNGLELDDPKLMDIAVPANRACGIRSAA